MGFESGALSFHAFFLPEGLEPTAMERFAARPLPPLKTLTGDQPIHGWAGPCHALDGDLSEAHCWRGDWLWFAHVTARRQVPPSYLRAAILDIIPADVTEAALAQVQATQEEAQRKEGDLTQRIAAMLEKFAAIGIDRDTIETYIGRSVDHITPALFARLGQAYKAITEGVSTADDIFGASRARATQKKEAAKS